MERIQSINIARIAWCCTDRGITPEDLAREVGISPASVEKIMSGDLGLTFNQLKQIAEFCGRGVLFFLEAGPVNEEQVHTPQFRTLANQKPELSAKVKALIERVERQRAVFLNLRDELDNGELARFDPPVLGGFTLNEAAEVVRRWLGLPDRNDFDNYRRALEARGLLVFRSNGYQGPWQIAKESPILGFSLYDAQCPVIVIKKQAAETQQSFTLMHELGHLLLHKTSSIDDDNDLHSHDGYEQDANKFAGYLLVPDSFLLSIRDEGRPNEVTELDDWMAPQRKAWGVSGEVILRRLMDAGRLNRAVYAAYRAWRQQLPTLNADDGGSRAFRNREPKHIFGEVYVKTVLDALSMRHITLAKASSYLDNLTIKDLHKLEQYYAVV
ncbi:ImmA/IrrE family metallo-endopeptidase [Chitinimonas arctica]|uniref:ImmA/IrrE family metallo-endopeptidase n=1 Tax=Chitinimonas arctica TaxID=2594795 RepID=A0A516SGE3_9NEIS|nr:XRE family transcriptional regulator [Chitinimonas arctica]QDQ27239.1 ImmA/IrrE family metallo-endopeptidase [Chitinimonas arctica]